MAFLHINCRLANTFNNEPVIDRPEFAMLGDILVGFTVVPVLRSFHVGEFRDDNSLNRIAFKNLIVPVSYQHFNRMASIVALIPAQYFSSSFRSMVFVLVNTM